MADEQKFKLGEIVKLRSGGPVMTVTAMDYNAGPYQLSWFAGAKLETCRHIPAAALIVASPEDSATIEATFHAVMEELTDREPHKCCKPRSLTIHSQDG